MQAREEKIKNLLTRNVETVIERSHLEAALRGTKKLRVKHGIDPTGDKIHLGRAVVLWKLREFQELGHKIVIIIGDFTAQIGDPSDKLSKRPFLSAAEVKKNLKNYLPQIGQILDLKKTEVCYNSEWLAALNFRETAELAETFSFQQMMKRRNFKERLAKEEDITLREFMYPLMQGYDSVAVKADIELGGTDQLFNLLAGRQIQEHYGQKPQDVMTTQMLLGLDGRKMSTSWGNVVNTVDPPDEQFGKIMSMHDNMVASYFRLTTRLDEKEIAGYEKKLQQGVNPRDIKKVLAREIVALYHGSAAAGKAAEKWEKIFSKKEISVQELRELKLRGGKVAPLVLVIVSRVVKSTSEAWRLITQGGVSIDGHIVRKPKELLTFRGGEVVKIGKKNFFRIKI